MHNRQNIHKQDGGENGIQEVQLSSVFETAKSAKNLGVKSKEGEMKKTVSDILDTDTATIGTIEPMTAIDVKKKIDNHILEIQKSMNRITVYLENTTITSIDKYKICDNCKIVLSLTADLMEMDNPRALKSAKKYSEFIKDVYGKILPKVDPYGIEIRKYGIALMQYIILKFKMLISKNALNNKDYSEMVELNAVLKRSLNYYKRTGNHDFNKIEEMIRVQDLVIEEYERLSKKS